MSQLNTLQQIRIYNEEIKDRLVDVELFVELNYDESRYDELIQLINECLSCGFSYQKIARDYPYVVACVMVLHGIFHYTEGSYWSGLVPAQNQRNEWVNALHQVLDQADMLRFDWIQNTWVHVTPILMHGGIPKNSLNDYFNYFLQRFINIRQRQYLSLQDFRDVWLRQQLQHVAMPVQRFISDGGDVALNWLQQSVVMAHHVKQFRLKHPKSTILSDDLLNRIELPKWVIQEYWQYIIQQRNIEQGEIISPPRIYYYGEVIVIDLPSQMLESNHGDCISWHIERQSSPAISISPFYDYRGRFIETRSDSYNDVSIDELFGLKIVLFQGERRVYEWSYQRPALVFSVNSSGAEYYTKAQTLPNRTVLIAVSATQSVFVDGVQIHCDLSTGLTDIHTIDVKNVTRSVIIGEVEYRIQENDEDLRPYLAYVQKLPFLQSQDAIPVYDDIPNIVIPLSRNSTLAEQIQQWRIQIIDVSFLPQHTVCIPKVALSDQRVMKAIDNDKTSIVVHLRRLLSQLQPGVYRIELFGRRASKVLKFIYIPGLKLIRPNQFHHPSLNRQSAPQQVELCDIPKDWYVESEFQNVDGRVIISFPPKSDTAELVFIHSTTNQKINIDLVFPRLEIRVTHHDGQMIAVDEAIVKDKQWYEETKPSIELVVMPITAPPIDNIHISSSVYVDDGNNPQQLAVKTDSSRRWFRIDTVAAYDTINMAPGGNAQITVHTATNTSQSLPISVVTIQRLVTLHDPQVQLSAISTGFRLSISWNAPNSPSNWRVVIWSLSRPWQTPLTYGVPNGVTSVQSIIAAGDLLPGETYLVGIMSIINVRDATPKLPPHSDGLLLLRVPGGAHMQTVDEHIAQLFVSDAANAAFGAMLEAALEASSSDEKIVLIQHFLLRTQQWLLYGLRTQQFDAYWRDFKRTIRPHIGVMNTYKTELLIATMCALRDTELVGIASKQVFERIIYACFPRLFEVLVKYEIRGALVMTYLLAYLPMLNERRLNRMQQYGIYIDDGIDEVFVDIGVIDNTHWYGLPVHIVDDSIKSILNNNTPTPITYDDALIATGTSVVAASPYPEVMDAKTQFIMDYRNMLFPSLMIWTLRQAHVRKNLNTAYTLSGWWYFRQNRVYELLNSYTVKHGGLHEYIEAGMFRN